jgi:quaternary ammonium compound-resistance protein SugE
MPWIYLLIAGVMEWGWPIGLKFASMPHHRWWAITLAVVSIVLSGVFLLLAQRTIPIGTAYAVWTGIGAVGTFALGIVLLGEPAAPARFFFVALILVGIAGLKLSSR